MRQREKLCRDAGTERKARSKAEENKRRLLGEIQNVSPKRPEQAKRKRSLEIGRREIAGSTHNKRHRSEHRPRETESQRKAKKTIRKAQTSGTDQGTKDRSKTEETRAKRR
jgi:hypothetical protein